VIFQGTAYLWEKVERAEGGEGDIRFKKKVCPKGCRQMIAQHEMFYGSPGRKDRPDRQGSGSEI